MADQMSLEELQRKAEAGDVEAQYQLGSIFLGVEEGPESVDVERDWKVGLDWLSKAVDQNYVPAQRRLGAAYTSLVEGEVLPEEWRSVGLELTEKAAVNGDGNAQYNLGMAYEKGRGLEEDEVQAMNWFRIGANQGHPQSMFKLATYLIPGLESGEDYAPGALDSDMVREGFSWLRKAMDAGVADAHALRGLFHSAKCSILNKKESPAVDAEGRMVFGDGVERELEAAQRCFTQALDLGCSSHLQSDVEEEIARVEESLLRMGHELARDDNFVVRQIKRNGSLLSFASEELRADREIVLEAVRSFGFALKYVSEEVRGDYEIVLEAVKSHGLALGYASEEVRRDRDVVLEAIKEHGGALDDASEELQYDPELIAIARPDEHWGDRKYVLQRLADVARLESAEEHELEVFRYAAYELQADRVFVLEAVKILGDALQYASEELRADREVVLEAVKQKWYALEYASKELRADRDVVLEAVNGDGDALGYASEELRGDQEIVTTAVKVHVQSFDLQWPHGQRSILFYDALRSFVSGSGLEHDKQSILELIKLDGMNLCCASDELRADREIVLAAVMQFGQSLQFASEELQNDQELIDIAEKQKEGKKVTHVQEMNCGDDGLPIQLIFYDD